MRRLLLAIIGALALMTALTVPANAIVGGQPETTVHPWMGSLQTKADGAHGCGASLIEPTWAVTAFHCVEAWQDTPELVQARFNSNDRTTGGVVVDIDHVELPPGAQIQGKDIALLKLAEPVNLPTISIAEASPAVGADVNLIGWGLTCTQSLPPLYYCGTAPVQLQGVTTTIADDLYCTGIPPFGIIGNSELCTGGFFTGRSSCFGDSGGPAIVDGKLVGVTSRLPHVLLYGNCQLSPNVYTDVTANAAWIHTVTGA